MMNRILSILFFLWSVPSFAGGDVTGNGGFGVGCQVGVLYQVHNLDLYEYTQENHACSSNYSETEEEVLTKANSYFTTHFSLEETKAVFDLYRTLSATASFDPPGLLTNNDLADPAHLPEEMKNIQSILADRCHLIQVGIFTDQLYIYAVNYNALSTLDRTAFFLHEAYYYYVRTHFGVNDSYEVRKVIGNAICGPSSSGGV